MKEQAASFKSQRFTDSKDTEFFTALRKRVSAYFETNEHSRHGDTNMALKTIFMFALYLTPYFINVFGDIHNPWITLSLWTIQGFGMIGIGLSVMHDANHQAYSSKKWVNKWLGYSINFIGANAEMWKLQHNRLHHTYTNVEGVDQDIDPPFFLRFSPHRERLKVHRFQHLYFWFFYGLITLSWVLFKDFAQVFRFRKMGLITTQKRFRKLLGEMILWKILYYTYILVIPIWLSPFSLGFDLICFFMMHFTAGVVLSLIFQTAHVMPSCEFPVADKTGTHENSWAVHEMLTTTNFSPNSRFFSWFIGGLNFQIEHHLFPSICHVHYKPLSKIVAQTASEYGIPYNSEKTFLKASWEHVKMLYQLGRKESIA